MKSISMLEFRLHAKRILTQVQQGQRMILTRRGKPVAKLEPIIEIPDRNDPFYSLTDLAGVGKPLSNAQIDELLYDTQTP